MKTEVGLYRYARGNAHLRARGGPLVNCQSVRDEDFSAKSFQKVAEGTDREFVSVCPSVQRPAASSSTASRVFPGRNGASQVHNLYTINQATSVGQGQSPAPQNQLA
jgi:hypothetical protein